MNAAAAGVSLLRNAIARGTGAILIGLVLAMVAIAAAQVILRYGFNSPLRWSEEAARYLLVWTTFLGAFEAYRRKWHLGLDVVTGALPESVGVWARHLNELLILLTLVWAVSTSGRLVQVSVNQTSAVLGLPMVVVYSGFLVGAGLICLEILLGWTQRLLSALAHQGPEAGTRSGAT